VASLLRQEPRFRKDILAEGCPLRGTKKTAARLAIRRGHRGGALVIPYCVVIIVTVYEELKSGEQEEPEDTQGNISNPETATNPATDLVMMRRALKEATRAAELGEVPVGAVVARGEEILAVAHNERETAKDPTAHAEILALRRAARKLGTWRLTDCTLYSTLEPCPMCAGALHAARVGRLVYATPDTKAGAAGTLYDLPSDTRLNHTYPYKAGVLQPESAVLLRAFFKRRRNKQRSLSESPHEGT
jgi:tRNA(adenine34) deaminase